jgi:hypothetical protein
VIAHYETHISKRLVAVVCEVWLPREGHLGVDAGRVEAHDNTAHVLGDVFGYSVIGVLVPTMTTTAAATVAAAFAVPGVDVNKTKDEAASDVRVREHRGLMRRYQHCQLPECTCPCGVDWDVGDRVVDESL